MKVLTQWASRLAGWIGAVVLALLIVSIAGEGILLVGADAAAHAHQVELQQLVKALTAEVHTLQASQKVGAADVLAVREDIRGVCAAIPHCHLPPLSDGTP